jgi:predicted TIM-barrel fold metal-dependent hydrolase
MKAIDIHAHFGIYDRGGAGLADGWMSGDIDLVRRRASAADVRMTVVSSLTALLPYGGDVLRGNEEAVEAAEGCDDIRFWAVLNPRVMETYVQVESLLSHDRCAGIKIHPREHQYDIREWGDPVFEFAANRKATVLTHSGHPGSDPEDFIPYVNRFPNATLILAHLGNDHEGDYTRQVHAVRFAEHGNVYVDTSSMKSMMSGLVEWAVDALGADRILFGTDSPLYFTASQKARVEYAEIDDTAKRAILFDNAAQLLGEESL